ncbi:MAG: hypothetical protein V1776_00970 [Candidatus Diapherotrites archaeon]
MIPRRQRVVRGKSGKRGPVVPRPSGGGVRILTRETLPEHVSYVRSFCKKNDYYSRAKGVGIKGRELEQEALNMLLRYIGKYDPSRGAVTTFIDIVLNSELPKWLKRMKKQRTASREITGEGIRSLWARPVTNPSRVGEWKDSLDFVKKVAKKILSSKQHNFFVHVMLKGYFPTKKEISEMGLTPQQVRSLFYLIRGKLSRDPRLKDIIKSLGKKTQLHPQ